MVLICVRQWDMDLVCRAHMVVEDGYEFWNDRSLVTVFSAPNYCGGTYLTRVRLCLDIHRALQSLTTTGHV